MRRSLLRAATAATLGMLAGSAMAQYKWQGADGGIVYSDLPPPPGVRLLTDRNGQPPREAAAPTLPYALKSVADKYPVTVYSVPDCPPCSTARQLLNDRGVPFAERSIASANDVDAFRALGFSEANFPGISVGSDRATGFEPATWNRLLDAAGYPKSSMLPSSFRQADAQPLTPPPTQRVKVSVSDSPAAEGGEIRSTPTDNAIERYRKLMQEAENSRQRDEDAKRPQIRF